jgi:hypothetical protein
MKILLFMSQKDNTDYFFENFLFNVLKHFLQGLTKFFGGVAKFHPKEVCSSNKTFVNSVFEGLTSSDQTHRSVSVQTVGFIGESVEGKMALDKLGL